MGSQSKRKRDLQSLTSSVAIPSSFGQYSDDVTIISEPSAKRLQQRQTLFVRALPSTVTSEKLIEHFSEAFPIKHATVVTYPGTKLCRGYGFVTFADAEDAQKAIHDYDNTVLDGRQVRLELAESRHRDIQEGIPKEQSKHRSVGKKNIELKSLKDQNKEQKKIYKLIIRNLPWSVKTAEQLRRLFLSYGKVKSAIVPQKGPGLQRGFGFVTIRGRKNAENALEGVNGLHVGGRTLAVDWAVDRDTWKAHSQVSLDSNARGDPKSSSHGKAEGEMWITEKLIVDEASQDAGYTSTEHCSKMAEPSDDLDASSTLSEGESRTRSATSHLREHDFAATIFIRNLPFTSTDETLHEHFRQFGGIRYTRIVIDPVTERSKGTGFVCFYDANDAEKCLRAAPPDTVGFRLTGDSKRSEQLSANRSVLQSEDSDSSGKFTMEGRILQVSRAVDRSEAARLTQLGIERRGHQENDKRRLYLLSEGTISQGSVLYSLLSTSEIAMREQSVKQRKKLIQSNPSLNLSLIRLSVRNIPRTFTSKDLKRLAREAVVGFASDVKLGKRDKISKEEIARDGNDMAEVEKERKAKGKGLVKQAKVIFEGREGAKIQEQNGVGRSRGYGFIEYYTHRAALMGLRWLNGHAIGYQTTEMEKGSINRSVREKSKRLIVEFAIENAQVVNRRRQREQTVRALGRRDIGTGTEPILRVSETGSGEYKQKRPTEAIDTSEVITKGRAKENEKLAARARIIAKKRAQRRGRRKASRGGR